jgi:hypothetical protein
MVETITTVDSLYQILVANEILIVVARVAAAIFTILFPMRIAIKSESGLALTFLRALAPDFLCLMRESTLCAAMLAKAVSLAEKNIESPIRRRNAIIERGFIQIKE